MRVIELKGLILNAENWVKQLFGEDTSGHDFYHTDRVRKAARTIAEKEGADAELCELAALLHDAGDDKFHPSEEAGKQFVKRWLQKQEVTNETIEKLIDIIETVSFKGGNNRPPASLEARVVQDADRLDAIGAIGIARCFMFAGYKGEAMYHPELKPRDIITKEAYRQERSSAINHFYEKLLKLSGLMTTETGKQMARERHQFLETFLHEFFAEWEGQR
ncbi:HD domain-containing protein [Salipaludibacillus agaradhaerens]|nr:HD domain-containing protein [Salipaludibacillus agaradhaerens]MCR6118927.1 HD domain-containing protein [Salipaludibacillus agaradhaerens]